MSTLEELTSPLTVTEARDAIYAAIAARGVTTTTWKPGAVVRTIVAALAIILAAFSSLQAAIAKSGFLLLASGDWLTLVARYVYGVERDTGTFAAGDVTVANSSGNVYTGVAGDLVFLNTSTGKTYRNTEPYSIGAHSSDIVIAVQAIELGSPSTAAASAIDALETTLLGVTCANASTIIGTDEENDATLTLRCQEKLGSLSPNGPADAYAYFARTAKTSAGLGAGVSRVKTIADGDGNVFVYLASSSGALTGTIGNLATPLGAADEAIQLNAVPECVTAIVASANTLAIDAAFEVWISDTVTTEDAALTAAVSASLAASLAAMPIGGDELTPGAGKVYKSALEAAVDAAFGVDLIKRTVSTPSGDTSCAVDDAPVLGTLTTTAIHRIRRAAV